MNRAALALVALGAAVLIAYATRRAGDALAVEAAEAGEGDAGSVFDYVDVWGVIERQWEQGQNEEAMQSRQMRAFLRTIRTAEGTERERDPYRVCYGYRHTIRDLAEHPAISGEWRGEPLDSLGPGYAGKISTAAGAYQIIRPTWVRAKRALGLADFSAASQDAAAAWLVRQAGAAAAVEAGRFAEAVALCAPTWASLPGSTAGQPTRQLAQLDKVFREAGGEVLA